MLTLIFFFQQAINPYLDEQASLWGLGLPPGPTPVKTLEGREVGGIPDLQDPGKML